MPNEKKLVSNKDKNILWNLSIGHFVLDSYAAILIPLYPYITQRLGINIAVISMVIAIGHAISSILQPVFGYISDKLNKRFFLFWGIIFASTFVPLGFNAPNVFILALCLMLGMAGNAFYHPQATTVIKDYYAKSSYLSKAIGIFLGLGTIGYALAPYFSTYILKLLTDRYYPLISLIGIFTAFIVIFYTPKLTPKIQAQKNNFLATLKEIAKNKSCILLIFITVIKASLIMSFGTYIPFLLKRYGLDLTQSGLIITLFYITGGISMIVSPKFEKYAGLKGIIALSYIPLLPLTLIAIYSLKYNILLASIFFIITGFFILFASGIVLSHAQKLAPNCSGTISGIIQGFTLALGSLLLIPFGLIAQYYSIEAVLIIISSIALICAVCCIKTRLL